jgi:hypothetical protein
MKSARNQKRRKVPTRFSDYFNLKKSQSELDFVDVPLDTDIPLFVDPYALSLDDDPWFIECNNLVIEYFQLLIEAIKTNDPSLALRLLSKLHEPNDTRLGFSKRFPSGRGVGPKQARDLYDRLQKSKAVKTGRLRDLGDCELLIPGISSDKISDITINIIRGKLVDYTELQCADLEIKTQRIPSGLFWDPERKSWFNRYAHLPVFQDERIILVPKAAVRFKLEIDHQQYYRHFVLQYLQSEHLNAGSSLVHVLKNGKRKVHKKDLQAKYPLGKEFLYEFSEKHPEVLERYKASLSRVPTPLSNEELEAFQIEPRELAINHIVQELKGTPAGPGAAHRYHDLIIGALETIFYPNLRKPVKEEHLHSGRKRVDIVFNNGGDRGFFADLITRHRVKCPYIFFECKNYSEDPANPEFDQLTGRFSKKRGEFGILVCRRITNRAKTLQHSKDALNDDRGYVLVIDDGDIEELIKMRAQQDSAGIASYMDELYRRLVM